MKRSYSPVYVNDSSKRSRRRFKRAYKAKIPRHVCEKSISISRTMEYANFSMPLTSNTWAATNYSFALTNLPAYTEFTELFDQYKITGIKVTFMPLYRDSLLGVASTASAIATPNIWIAASDDGSQNLSTQIKAMQVQNARMISDPYKPFSIFLKPKFILETVVGLGIAGTHSKSGGWLDTDNPNVLHYGLAIGGDSPGVPATTSFNPMVYSVFAKYYMQFKDPR